MLCSSLSCRPTTPPHYGDTHISIKILPSLCRNPFQFSEAFSRAWALQHALSWRAAACASGESVMGSNHLLCASNLLHFFPVRAASLSPIICIERFYCCCLLYEQNVCYVCAKWTTWLLFTCISGAVFPSLWVAYLTNFCCGFKSVWQKGNVCTGSYLYKSYLC